MVPCEMHSVFWISVLRFIWGRQLTYDKVLDVLGAVDTEVFSRLLRKVLAGDVTAAIRISGRADCRRQGTESVCRRFYLVYAESSSCQDFG